MRLSGKMNKPLLQSAEKGRKNTDFPTCSRVLLIHALEHAYPKHLKTSYTKGSQGAFSDRQLMLTRQDVGFGRDERQLSLFVESYHGCECLGHCTRAVFFWISLRKTTCNHRWRSIISEKMLLHNIFFQYVLSLNLEIGHKLLVRMVG